MIDGPGDSSHSGAMHVVALLLTPQQLRQRRDEIIGTLAATNGMPLESALRMIEQSPLPPAETSTPTPHKAE